MKNFYSAPFISISSGIAVKAGQLKTKVIPNTDEEKYCGCVTHMREEKCFFVFSRNGSNNVLIPEVKQLWELLELEGEISEIREIEAMDVTGEVFRAVFLDTLERLEESFGRDRLNKYCINEYIMNMAQRLYIVPHSTITDKQLTTLLAEDFQCLSSA